ncbi:type II secretion system major pseudopilin GspG [Humisphaera borealis]|uniref:Type II secretion system core protein G n=1 Tax=Humisphaera borealis TaxID=2807512 RepID=A0A7M2WW92_9BACT|nr:type II secretion system major pseudopilin GspG [Humisphaera borealis]QOV89817.1 type II secretion system major pseudopilin GspG [Humisphaera borealis]
MSVHSRTQVRRVRRSAFTLIELLLVLVILAVLAAIVVPKFTGRTDDAKIGAAKTTVRTIEGALDLFEQDNGRYPTTEEGIRALIEMPANVTNWKAPYFKGDTKDPWGNEYGYRYPGTVNTHGPDVFSFGKDGKEGGGDDLGNWVTETK